MVLKDKKLLYLFDARDVDSRVLLAHAAHYRGMDVVIGLIGTEGQIAAARGKIEYVRAIDIPSSEGVFRGPVRLVRK